jgi:hypothetical protein
MDLRAYYKKVREIEAQLQGDHLVVVSLETPEGGKPGVRTEASRSVAAKLIAEGRARVASDEEGVEFYDRQREDRERYEVEQAARRMQVMVIPQPDPRKSKERN